jgi:predicted MFS family arabinose efflux permease
MLLLGTGVAGLLGTWLIGLALRSRLHGLLVAMPLAMTAIAVALIGFGGVPAIVGVLLAAWGLVGTAAPVGWWTWLSKVLPDDAESGGGLMVAVIQLAIALGATAGGIVWDASGYRSTFALAAAALCLSALLALAACRRGGDALRDDSTRGERASSEATRARAA